MHTKSGLLEAVRASTITLADAGAQTLAFIKEHVPDASTVPLCGNSIGTDRRFLAAYLPEIEDWLHYRSVDVSSVKELVRRWYPEVRAERPKKIGAHRALDDIRESVARAALLPRARVRPGGGLGPPGGHGVGRRSVPGLSRPTAELHRSCYRQVS